MAHFAQLDQNNIVMSVVVINNATIENMQFPQSEPVGVEFCKSLYGQDSAWVQTSYSASFRKNYAGIGYLFDSSVQPYGAFIPPALYPSWVLDTATYQWSAPVPYPNDGELYEWSEATLSWVLVEPQPVPEPIEPFVENSADILYTEPTDYLNIPDSVTGGAI